MGTRRVKLIGLGYWAKVFEDNRDLTGFEDALKDIGGQTTIDMDLDTEMMDKLRASKSMKKGSKSPENEDLTRVRFTRKWQENYGGGTPKVIKADGTDWDYDEDGPIGNGSVVEVVLNVYDTSRKSIVGTRLEKVKVLEHVRYEPDEEDEDDTPAPVRQSTSAKPKAKAPVEDLEDDEIPF
jgi:hypothetical protein